MKLFFSPCILAAVLPSFLSVIRRLPITLGLAASLFSIAAAADSSDITTVFSKPARYCFDQGYLGTDMRRATLSYNLVIPPADHFKPGDIYVGFRQRSVPDVLWIPLPGNLNLWSKYNPQQQEVVPFQKAIIDGLQPVEPLYIVQNPIDLTRLIGDGELLVGYGLRTTAQATPKDSFQDMLDNKRFSVIWVVGSGAIGGGMAVYGVQNFPSKRICLKVTEMTQQIMGYPN